MTDEYIPLAELNMATGGEDIEVKVTSKDEPVITTTVDENGYESECSSSARSEEDVARSALEIEADAFTRFIERQRVEVMFELRRIRLGERPVTGQPNRERIETFLNHIQDHQQVTRVPSTRPALPSAHMADIDALTNRRCVSAALSSAAFRQDLENAVRQSIGTRPVAPVQRTPQASSPVAMTPEARPQASTPVVMTPQERPQASSPGTMTPEERPQASVSVTVERQAPLNIERQERELNAWQAITQLQREMIVLDISDLVHRQLVTSALESDFRRDLERNVLTRMAHGAPLQQNQQAAPTALIPPVFPQPTTTNARVSAAASDALTSRLDSMQQMLQLMFSMQMDMQRSLRQEVASALAHNTSATTTNPSIQPMNAGQCTICLTATADTVLYRCGHLCVCYMCGLQLQHATNDVKCPVCRAPVDDILRVYRSSRDGE